jgi:integron cassette protein
MPARVADVETLQTYIRGVMDRAAHHAGNVDDVCLTLAGALVWRKDPGTDLQVMAYAGDMKNVLWVYIGAQRYALSYNHQTGAIEIRAGSVQGPILASFTNGSTAATVKSFFVTL